MERDAAGRFVKGHSGGPGRPPAEFSPTQMLRVELAKKPAVLMRLLELAESEDENVAVKALTYLVNRLDGMPKQSTELTGENGGPVELKWHDNSSA